MGGRDHGFEIWSSTTTDTWFHFEKWLCKWHFLPQQIYKQCSFCFRFADLNMNPSLAPSFYCLFFKKQYLFFVTKNDGTCTRKKKIKPRLWFSYCIGLMVLLRLNYILPLRSPVRHFIERCRLCCLLVPLQNLHKNISQIQPWASDHPCCQSFSAPWHCCLESKGNDSQTCGRRLSLVTDIHAKPLYTVQTS